MFRGNFMMNKKFVGKFVGNSWELTTTLPLLVAQPPQRGSAYASSYTIQGLASRTVFPAFSQSTIHNPFFSPTSSQCFHNPQSTIRVPLPSSFSESTIHNPTLIAITIYLARHGHLVWFPFWSDHCINPDEINSFKKQNVFPFQAQ